MDEVDLLKRIITKCYYISNNSKTDVFFSYGPHCNCYEINYYFNGFDYKEPVYINLCTDINIKNLQETIKELDKLWELIVENNLNKN